MNKPRELLAAFTLILALSMAALAGDINTPPCTPGDINTPPCTVTQVAIDDQSNTEETQSPTVAEIVVITAICDGAVGSLLSVF